MITSATSDPDTDTLGVSLLGLVEELVVSYDTLVDLAERRLQAIRTSDAPALASCITRENLIVQRVAEIERDRARVVTDLAQRLGSEKQGATRVTWIARRLPDSLGEPLLGLCARLRSQGERLKATNEVSRTAAEHLANHMTGLLQAVSRHLNHAKTYSRAGNVEAGARVVSSLDIST